MALRERIEGEVAAVRNADLRRTDHGHPNDRAEAQGPRHVRRPRAVPPRPLITTR